MLYDVPGLAMHRNGDPGLYPLIHADELVAVRMARDVNEPVFLGNNLGAEGGKLVVQPKDRLLVAGDDLGGEDHGVAGLDHNVGVIVDRDPGERCPPFALAAGAGDERAFRRQIGDLLLAQEMDVPQIPVLPRHVVHTPQRAATKRGMPIVRCRDRGDGLEACDVAGETRHEHAPVGLADQLGEALTECALGARMPGLEHVRRIAHHGEHALVRQALQGIFVRRRAH